MLIAGAAAAGDGGEDGDLASLEGTSWRLLAGVGLSVPGETSMTIAFAEGRVTGSGGCNRFTGAYEQDGATISLGPLASTRMACLPEVMDAEAAFFRSLESVTSWSENEAELVLATAADDELRFAAAVGLRAEPEG